MDKDKKKDKDFILKEQRLTYDDYAALDDDNRYELVDGKLELMSPAPSPAHQVISLHLLRRIADTCESLYIILNAPIDVIFSKTEVRQPDIIMIHRSRLGIITKRGIEGPPDLVVEVLSPTTRRRDKVGKMFTYAKYEVPEYWILDPSNGTLEQYELNENYYTLTEVYSGPDQVRSDRLACVSFNMDDIMKGVKDLPN